MYLEIVFNKKNNKTYLYKAQSIKKDKKVIKTRIKLGDLDLLKETLKDKTDDPIKYYKEEIDKYNKLSKLDKLDTQIIGKVSNSNLFDDVIEDDETFSDNDKNLGSIFPLKIFHKLWLNDVCQLIKRKEDISLPLNKVLQLEIFSRIIDPSSKYNDFKNKDNFADKYNISLDNIYDSLNYYYKYKDEFIKSIEKNITTYLKPNMNYLHTDGSNIYVYTKEYKEIIDNNNIDIRYKTLLRKGYSKEGKRLPIAQFMYITDKEGLPLNFKAYEGNKPDVSLYNDFINETRDIYNIKKSVIVADAGFVSNDNIVNTIASGNHYIFKESMLRLSKSVYDSFKVNVLPLVDEIIKDNPNFKGFYKSINIDVNRNVVNIYGEIKKVKLTQKYVFVYSKNIDDKYSKIRVDELKRVDELIKDKKKLEQIFKKLSSSLTKVANSEDVIVELDEEKLNKYKEISGFSVLITDLLDTDEKEIIKAYRNQYLIEDTFRNLKSNFEIRPVFLQTEEKIKSHMLICFLALLFCKIIYLGLNRKYSIVEIQKAISILRLSQFDGSNYMKIKGVNIITKDIAKFLDIPFTTKYVTGLEVRHLISVCKKNV